MHPRRAQAEFWREAPPAPCPNQYEEENRWHIFYCDMLFKSVSVKKKPQGNSCGKLSITCIATTAYATGMRQTRTTTMLYCYTLP